MLPFQAGSPAVGPKLSAPQLAGRPLAKHRVVQGAPSQADDRDGSSATSWRAHLGVGATLLAQRRCGKAARRRVALAAKKKSAETVADFKKPTKADVTFVLNKWRDSEGQLREVLSKDATLADEYMAMQPKFDEGKDLSDLSDDISAWQQHNRKGSTPKCLASTIQNRGLISACATFSMTYGKGFIAICIIRVGNGLVCGLGAAANKKTSEHLAIAQTLERLSPVDAKLEYSRISDEFEDAITAGQIAEHLAPHIQNGRLEVFQPFGESWKAGFSGRLQSRLLQATSADTHSTRDAAVASTALPLVQQVRLALRIGAGEPNAPEEWAEKLVFQVNAQNLTLGNLGVGGAEDTLRELLTNEEEREAIRAALEDATERQAARISAMEAMMLGVDEEGNAEDAGPVVARRVWEVTKPEDEDWRREEVKGKLPAEAVREEMSRVLEYDQVVIVSGGTGSGKSTQLPQFLLDDFREWEVEYPGQDKGEKAKVELEVGGVIEVEFEEVWYRCEILEVAEDQKTVTCKYFEGGDEEGEIDVETRVRAARPRWSSEKPRIVCTQPRRIAALSLAQRVAWERFADECGGEIGYCMRGDSCFPECETGTIEYCTVGTLLKRLVSDPALSKYNVVMLDEVHERDLFTDYLLILMKEVLEKRPDLRLVLMSATLDVQTFTNFLPGSKTIEVPVGTRYPVEEIHLDDEFFQGFSQTESLIREERTAREALGASSGGAEHDFSMASKTEEADSLAEQVNKMVKKAADVKKAWKTYCAETGSDEDPHTHTIAALRVFIARVGEEDQEDTNEYSAAVLSDQIRQMAIFSDKTREALVEFSEGKEDTMELWDTQDHLAFLNDQGVRPWMADSLEITTSQTWWGSETSPSKSTTPLLELISNTILSVYTDLLNVDDDDEIGVGSILVFLPGWAEIRDLGKRLEASKPEELWILRLHSQVDKDEQQQVFERAPEGKVKVILSTNIAESSVTIDDVRCIIDTGLHREMTYDYKRRMSALDTVWIGQSNAVQRKGRAGRVRSGRVYRMYTKEQFEYSPWRPSPEMQRCNLAQTCLSSIHMGRDPREFLTKAPDPPPVTAVEAAMAELEGISAIIDGHPPRMMPLGHVLSRMPLDPFLGRAMVLGALFGIPQMTAAVLTVANGRSPFQARPDQRKQLVEVQKAFCAWSDVIGTLRAVKEFEDVVMNKGYYVAEQWCRQYALNYQALCNLSRQKFRLLLDVQRSGMLDAASHEGMDPDEWGWGEDGEGWEDSGDAAAFHQQSGALFDAEENQDMMQRKEWLETVRNTEREVDDERLLVGILCAANPTNMAIRRKAEHQNHSTFGTSNARMGSRSVNSTVKADGEESIPLPSPSWWHYSDSRLFNGNLSLTESTLLSPWHVALFAGLRDSQNEHGELLMDKWIVLDQRVSQSDLVVPLREEIKQALVWACIATCWDKVAVGAVARSKAVLRLVGNAILGQELSEEDVQFIRDWQLPTVEEGEASLSATEDMRDELEEKLMSKTVVELKVLLREMGASVSGRKADLVVRCIDHLIYGEEQEYNEYGEVEALMGELEEA